MNVCWWNFEYLFRKKDKESIKEIINRNNYKNDILHTLLIEIDKYNEENIRQQLQNDVFKVFKYNNITIYLSI